MEPTAGKPGSPRNLLTRFLLFGVLVIGVRFAYLIAVAGESCNIGDFCFFSLPETLSLIIAGTGPLAVESASGGGSAQPELYTSKDWTNGVRFYSSAFQDLIAGGSIIEIFNSIRETKLG